MEIAVISETEKENEMEETLIYIVPDGRNPSKGVPSVSATIDSFPRNISTCDQTDHRFAAVRTEPTPVPAATSGHNVTRLTECRILALDLGTVTGWAACIDGHVQSGTWTFRPSRYEGGGMRYVRFRNQLAEAQ